MEHSKILKRAFEITWIYRALWVFGILLALTTASSTGSGGGGGGGRGGGGGSSSLPFDIDPRITAAAVDNLVGIGLMFLCLVLIIGIVFVVLRYVAETALIRMVDNYEDTGEQVSVREGFRLGWSRGALRIFLINLLFGVVGFIIIFLMMIIAAAPLLLLLVENEPIQIIGVITAIGLFFLLILFIIVVVIAISLLLQFIWRAAVLEDRGVFDAIRRGWEILLRRLGDIVLMGILIFALGLVFTILMIPVFILLFLAALVVGGLPGLFVGWIVGLFVEGAAPWIAGAAVALPIFVLIVIAPMLFLGGLVETYKSTAWTLTYREAVALEIGEVEPESELGE